MTQRRASAGWASGQEGATSATRVPTSLDRILVRAQSAMPTLTLTSRLLVVVVTSLLALADVAVWVTDPVVDNGRLSISLAFLVPTLGVLATVSVAVRTRHAARALTLLAAFSVVLTTASWAIGASLPPSFAALFALALLTARVLRVEQGGTALVLTALAAAAVAAEALRPMVDTAGYLLVVCELAFGLAVGVGTYLRWSDWRRAMASEAARVEERLEIARELHDLVGHHVTGIVVQAQAARHVAVRQPDAASAALGRIEEAGVDALAAMRQIVGGLRDDHLASRASWDDIDGLIDVAIADGEPVRAMIDPGVRGLPTALVPSVHRILAESLTNVRRHGRAVTSVEVEVRIDDDHLRVMVHNDGSTAPPGRPDTFGLVGMEERAQALGGSLVAGPAPDGGWIVRAELPAGAR